MKNRIFFILIATICFTASSTFAQHQKNHVKGSYVDSLGKYYQQAELPLYIYVSTSPDASPIQLKEVEMKEPKPIYLDGEGMHNLRHINTEEKRVENFRIYADATAPTSIVSLSSPNKYVAGGKSYFGKNLTLSLQASDNMSGVKETLLSLNGAEYLPYKHSIAIAEEGNFTYKYYSLDNVGNVEAVKEKSFIVDVSAPKTYYKIVGITDSKVISLTTQIDLVAEDSLSGISATYYSFDGEPYKKANKQVPIKHLDNGEHTLLFYSIDNVNNEEAVQSLTFYLDRTAPIMSADILGDKFIVEDKVYFSGRTKVKLTAIDNRAGVDAVNFSINDGDFELYTEPFYLPNKSGEYVIRYYATDNVGNNTGEDKTTHSSGVVYVDLTGPIITNSFAGEIFKSGDVTYISSRVGNKVLATDDESGLQRLAYMVDGGEEQPYSIPFMVEEEGAHKITAVAYDNVNNRNEKSYNIFVDNKGPNIGYSFSTNPIGVDEDDVETYPSYVTLFLNALDEVTTVSSISFSINGGTEQPYVSPIQNFEKSKLYSIKVRAVDVLGNESVKVFTFKTNGI